MLWQAFSHIKESISLFILSFAVRKRNIIEAWHVCRRYYHNRLFLKVDLLYVFAYLFRNPYNISKRFLKNLGAENVYAYGETPLTTMDLIAKEASITKDDTVFELGCGRGLTVFWLHCFIGCRVIGIEWVPKFLQKAI
ncbi:hypothetical protein SCG7109_BS_00030 [Chlamydiales bacterium SCGC AG-110-M15]|nr:hypothetical protein SCG7109_BS_00030 [Chlamydiales bacterium SCGC AG-110-M15]